MIQFYGGWFVVFLIASHLHSKFQSYYDLATLHGSWKSQSRHLRMVFFWVDSQTSCVGEELNAQACFLRQRQNILFNIHLHLICVVYMCLNCLSRCRVPYLVDEYSCAGFKVHHFPVEEGNVPTMADCSDMIEQLRQCISFGHKTLLQ